ncbi:hypothetical protein EDD85DRAFT_784302 [Armillaria nabsnona]|nr:hypothetical protein EDD85DRAFT_784302 [Armillaria nabsnona]
MGESYALRLDAWSGVRSPERVHQTVHKCEGVGHENFEETDIYILTIWDIEGHWIHDGSSITERIQIVTAVVTDRKPIRIRAGLGRAFEAQAGLEQAQAQYIPQGFGLGLKAFLKQSLSLSLEQALLAGRAFQGWVRLGWAGLGLRLEARPFTTLHQTIARSEMRIAIDEISDVWHSVDWAWRVRGEIRGELDLCAGSFPLAKMNEVCLYRQADVRVVWVFDGYNMSREPGFGSIIENLLQGVRDIAMDVKWGVFGSFP